MEIRVNWRCVKTVSFLTCRVLKGLVNVALLRQKLINVDAYGDMHCSSRRVVGIVAERPPKRVVAATWRGTVVHSVNTKTGKIIIMYADSRHRVLMRTLHREGVLRTPTHLRNQLGAAVVLPWPEWPRPLLQQTQYHLLVIMSWKLPPRRRDTYPLVINLCQVWHRNHAQQDSG